MSKQIVNTEKAPAPIGPYNQAIKTDHLLFISGQVAIDPDTGEIIKDDIKKETHRVMMNLSAIISEAHITFEHVIKTTIFLSDMSLFGEVNEIYSSYFNSDYPVRETVAVKGLPKDANVEISMIATLNL